MISSLHFSHPWVWGLTVLPVVVFALGWTRAGRRAPSLVFSAFPWIPISFDSLSFCPRVAEILRFLAVLSVLPVMAGIRSQTPIQASSRTPPALLIVLDISSSMTAEDFKPENRLQEAKKDLKNFIANNPHAVVGLMVFAAVPRLLVPLTSDHETVLKALEKAAPAGYGEDGTALGSGIASAANRLRNGTWSSRKILLITDGVNNRGALTPLDAARLARELGISIHAVGLGTNEMARYFVPSAAGSLTEVRARIDIDDEALAALAQATDGSYQRVRNSEELGRALSSISLGEARAESTSSAGEELFWVRACTWTALLLLAVEFALVQFVISELPG